MLTAVSFNRRILAGFGALLSAAAVAHAQDTKGDPEYGEYLSSECVTCHNNTQDHTGIPRIAGLPAEGMIILLKAYKNKELSNETMQTIAASLDDEQMAAIAAYYESLKDK
jgi:cytochrome c